MPKVGLLKLASVGTSRGLSEHTHTHTYSHTCEVLVTGGGETGRTKYCCASVKQRNECWPCWGAASIGAKLPAVSKYILAPSLRLLRANTSHPCRLVAWVKKLFGELLLCLCVCVCAFLVYFSLLHSAPFSAAHYYYHPMG